MYGLSTFVHEHEVSEIPDIMRSDDTVIPERLTWACYYTHKMFILYNQ